MSQPPATAKEALRQRLIAKRRALPTDSGPQAAALCARALTLPALAEASCVAAYSPLPGEPDVGPLLEELHRRGVRILLPVLRPDRDLGWQLYRGNGADLGLGAIADAELALVPGLAVSSSGVRLGRGGGSYDRALTRPPPDRPTAVVLWPHEVGLEVPAEPHDVPVSHALTTQSWHKFAVDQRE